MQTISNLDYRIKNDATPTFKRQPFTSNSEYGIFIVCGSETVKLEKLSNDLLRHTHTFSMRESDRENEPQSGNMEEECISCSATTTKNRKTHRWSQ